jgi:hypothetical protein
MPFGPKSFVPANLQWLTTEQILEDYVDVRSFIFVVFCLCYFVVLSSSVRF